MVMRAVGRNPRGIVMEQRRPLPATSVVHVGDNLKTIFALLKVAASTVFKGGDEGAEIDVPGAEVVHDISPISSELLEAYEAWAGCSPTEAIPAHLFPQWSFATMIEALAALPFPMTVVLNQGCRLEISDTSRIRLTG